MATDDLQILVAGQAAAPAGFTIPGNGQIKPKAMNAIFDGSGAAGDFMPTLEIISDAGIVVARVAASTVTAGNSAEVTWAPFLEAAQAAVAAGGVAYAVASGENLTLASGGGYKTITLNAGTFLTSSASTFAIHAVGGFNGIQINTLGTYRVGVGTQGFPNGAVAAGAAVGVALLGAGAVNFENPGEVAPWTQRADGGGYQGNAFQSFIIEVGLAANPVGLTLRVQAGQNTGGTADMSVFLTVMQLDTTNP